MDEYRDFYRDFVGVPEEDLEKVTREGYRAMTAVRSSSLSDNESVSCYSCRLPGRGPQADAGELQLLLRQLPAGPLHLRSGKVHLWRL